METATIAPVLFEESCRIIKIINAVEHNKKPGKGINLLAPNCVMAFKPHKIYDGKNQ